MPEVEVPVLIVGAGPAGLTTALALSRYGVKVMLAEKYAGTAHTPRAHIVNQRTVEIMRHLGVEDRLREVATPPEMMRNTLWVTSLAGQEVARLESWGTGPERSAEYNSASPSPMLNCPQTMFEPVLLDAVNDAGCDVRHEYEFLEHEQTADGVLSTLRHRTTGETLTVKSDYLVGADGARSRILEQADLRVEGPSGMAHCLNIWFRADLAPYLAHRPGVLTWNLAPGPLPSTRLGTLICHRPFTEFVLVVLYDPDSEDPSNWDNAELIQRVHACVGDSSVDVEILGSATWAVNAQVAPQYSAGRVFCMGDAVHRHPPTNGLGLNLSVADAFNLAWKLALVLRGDAAAELLTTYSDERQPVGAAGVKRAITSRGEIAAVSSALGYETGQSEADGQALLHLLQTVGPEGDAHRAKLRAAIEQTNLQFNAHGVEIGYCYRSSAVAGPGESASSELYYRPTTSPGARVPHARLGTATSEVSTLDLVDGLGFTLLTGISGDRWLDAAAEATRRFGVEVNVRAIGPAGDLQDLYGEWAERREVSEGGCVLVRPDRHIGWRANDFGPESTEGLCGALHQILGYTASADRAPAGASSTFSRAD